jgi:hypothetical protein
LACGTGYDGSTANSGRTACAADQGSSTPGISGGTRGTTGNNDGAALGSGKAGNAKRGIPARNRVGDDGRIGQTT